MSNPSNPSTNGIGEFFTGLAGELVKVVQDQHEAPPVGATVRYHGSLARNHGLYKVVAILGDEGQLNRPVEITNGSKTLRVNARSITLEPGSTARPVIPVGKNDAPRQALSPKVGMLVWYRGTLRKFHGVAMITAIEGDRLSMRGGVDGQGGGFYCRPDSVSRVSVAEYHDEAFALCGFCHSQLERVTRGSKCGRCHQRVVAATNPYTGVDTVPADCPLPQVSLGIAQRTTSK